MNCPHCGHDKSRVTETRANTEADRRIRLCQGCGRTFQTLERVCVFAGRAAGYVEVGQPAPVLTAVPDPEPQPARARPAARHQATLDDERLSYVTPDARPLLVQWWNESRKSKHGAKATWTEAAWVASVQRVANLPTDLQLALCRAGVESGWQALKLEYLQGQGSGRVQPVPSATGRPMPKDPAMLAALEQWPSQTA
jgi:hypothetical protein